MKLTDEMVEKIADDGDLCDAMAAEFGYLPAPNAVRYILTAYHRLLSTQEPPEELVKMVARAVQRTPLTSNSRLDWPAVSRTAIKETWRVG